MENSKYENSHLKNVFEQILPRLEDSEIRYWVYAGVGVAGITEKFIRKNNDVDVYVCEEDFLKTRDVLGLLCKKNDWGLREGEPNEHSRPKIDIIVGGKEIFSVVPIYIVNGGDIEFRAKTKTLLPKNALCLEEKIIQGNKFYSATKEAVKCILRSLLIERPDQLEPSSRRSIDAMAVFTHEEIKEIKDAIQKKRNG
jgi:hypothetical protein